MYEAGDTLRRRLTGTIDRIGLMGTGRDLKWGVELSETASAGYMTLSADGERMGK
jgi:hypothetical protein